MNGPVNSSVGGLLVAVADLSRSQLVLRALIFLSSLVAVFATGPAGQWPPWWVAIGFALLAGGFAALPDSPLGAGLMLGVLAWWAVALDDGLQPAVLVAAVALLTAHVAAVLVGYGPGGMPVDSQLVWLWVRRGAAVLLGVPLVWGLAWWLRDAPEQPGVWVVGVSASLAATVAAAVALTARRAGDDQG